MESFMITFNEYDIMYVIIAASLCSTMSFLHKVLLPNAYVPSLQYTYSDDKKTTKSTIIRILYLIAITTFLLHIFDINKWHIVTGIFLSSYLNVWPAIKQYQLLRLKKSDAAWKLLLAYFLFIIISCLIVILTSDQLIPSFYNKPTVLNFFSNPSVSVVFSLVLYLIPFSIEKTAAKLFRVVNERIIDTFKAEIKVLEVLISIKNPNMIPYHKEIEKSALENNIPLELLETILFLENVYRNSYMNTLIEKIICIFFRPIAIKKDISIGLSQIKISTATQVMNLSNYEVIPLLICENSNINICARYLKQILKEYNNLPYKENITVYYFLASCYLGTPTYALDYTTLVYSTILENRVKVLNKNPNI